MKKISSLSLDALDDISRATRMFLYRLTERLCDSPVPLEGMYIPLAEAPFASEPYRCLELSIDSGTPVLKVAMGEDEVTCNIPLRSMSHADIMSLLEVTARVCA